MGLTRFGASSSLTVGVEEEFQLVDPDSGDLVSRIDEVLEKSQPSHESELQSELFQSMVETATPVCEDVDELREELTRLRGLLSDLGSERALAIGASGTHPFAKWEEQDVTPEDRYEQLLRDIRLPIKRELVFGQHVHVAVGSTKEAIRVTNRIRPFLPLVLALSTNAPFWRGIDSGMQSARVRVFDAMPRSGLPRTFHGWADLQGAVELLKQAGSIEDMTKIWWDVRPRPTFGTVEVRIADLPTELDRSVALAAFTQALVARLRDGPGLELPVPLVDHPEAVRENRWRAMRDGVEAEFIGLEATGDVVTAPVAELMGEVTTFLGPAVDELGLKDEIAHLAGIAQRGQTEADRQREVYASTGSLREVVLDVVERTAP